MATKKESDDVLQVKINMENNEIELVENNEDDKTVTVGRDTFIINDFSSKKSDVVNFVIVDDEHEGDIIDEDDEDDEEETEKGEQKDDDNVQEIVEHVCGKCFKVYRNVNRLQKHLTFCRTQTKINTSTMQSEYIKQLENNMKETEKAARKMEKTNLCFCCEENFDTYHSGHIRCYECPKSFKNTKSFERHLFFIHSGNEQFPCKTCNARCPSAGILELHESQHQSRGKPFACKKCGKDFTRPYHLYRHQKFSTCNNAKPKEGLLCKVCSRVFYRIDNLRSHLRQHLGDDTKKRDYQCPYCEKSFYGTSTLNIHIRTHTGERPFPCDLCDKHFPSNAALRKHRRSHTGEKPYSCSVCSKCFAAKEVLNRHMKTHTGERPHSCDKCNKSFIQATQLRLHEKFHHKSEVIKCDICNISFNFQGRYDKHMKSAHSTKKDEEPHCEICSRNFKSIGGLKKHNTTKHNSQFECGTCKAMFSSEKDRDFHSLRHDDDDAKSVVSVLPSSVNDGLQSPERDNEYTIILQSNDDSQDMQVKTDPDLEESNHTLMEVEDVEDGVIAMDEQTLKKNIGKLLDILLERDILMKFGWPTADVEHVLQDVIMNCGHNPPNYDDYMDYPTKMREYVKLLFTVVIDNDSIKELLNNHSIDEVINQVLKMANVNGF